MEKVRPSAAQCAGFLAVALGLVGGLPWVLPPAAFGWWSLGSTEDRPLTAALFVIAGLGLLMAARGAEGRMTRTIRRSQTVAIALLLLLPAASLAASVACALLGIDLTLAGAAATPQRAFAGWMPITAGLAFAATGAGFAALRSRRFERHRRAFLALLAAVALIALTGVLGHFLGIEQLYDIGWLIRLSPATALGLGALAIGLWTLYERTLRLDAEAVHIGERRIHRRALVVVSLVALLGGAAGFTAMRATFEQSVAQNQQLLASTTATSLANALDLQLWLSRTVATRPTVQLTMATLNAQPDDPVAQRTLQRIADSFRTDELSSAQFVGVDGRLLASAGASVKAGVELNHALRRIGQPPAVLAFHRGYLLLAENDVVHDGRKVGRVLTEQRLPLFDRLLEELRASSPTADAVICSRLDKTLRCGATKFRKQPFERPLFDSAGQPTLPVVRALLGTQGVVFAKDPRGVDSISAYAPIKDYGLGLGVRNDVRTLMLPMKDRLNLLLMALAALVGLAVVALRTQVRPLVHRLARSERHVQAVVEQQSTLIEQSRAEVAERQLAEVALARHRALLESTGSLAGVGGWALDLATQRLEWTAQLRRIHEVDDAYQPTLQGALQFYEPQAQLVVLTAIDNAIATGAPWNLELAFVTARGRRLWVRTQGQAELDGERVVRLVGALQDITERKTLQIRLAESERFVRKITDNVPVRLAYGDREGRYRFVNQAHCQRFGLRRDQIIGHTRDELMVGRTSENVDGRVAAVLAGTEQRFEFEEMVDGRLVRIESRLLPDIDETGEVRGFYAIGVDVTERSAAEREQRRQAATLRSVTEAIPALVAVVGADGRYRFVNSAFERWSGRPREALIGCTMAQVLGPREHQRSLPWIERALAGETVSFEKEFGPHDAVQHLSISYIPLIVENGEVDGFVAVAFDITQHKQEEGRLLELAERDPLTGLMNRAGFERFTETRLAQARPGHMLALIYVDLDHFKPVNDRHGHAVGDVLLQQFAQRMSAVVRPSDAVARLGGDEFAIALIGVRERRHAEAVAAKLIAAASAPFEVDGLQLRIGASAGVAFAGDAGFDLRQLIAEADARLYEAKAAGRGRHVGAT